MEKRIMSVLSPDFYKEFHCVASACRANCCTHHWNIYIDKKNYKLLRGLKEPKWLSESFSKFIRRNTVGNETSSYAVILQDAQGCAFQTDDGLCRIQAELGPEYLCRTCYNYPRTQSFYVATASGAVQQERCLNISCEEVARLLLQKREPIQFYVGEQEYNPTNFSVENRYANNFTVSDQQRPVLAHYGLIRAVGIAVLQNRDYTIEQRLALLVVYLDKVAEAEATPDSIPTLTDTFVQAVEQRLYDRLFSAKTIPEVAIALPNFATLYALGQNLNSDIVKRCMETIGQTEYDLRAASYQTLAKEKEYFLEHLLVMEFFGKGMPFANNRSIKDCTQYLVSVYAILRFMLGAYLGDKTDLPDTDFIDFIAFFGKEVLHSASSFDHNIALLQQNGMDTLPYLLSMVLG